MSSWEWIKNLLYRLRGGKPKRSPKKIIQSHRPQIKSEPPPWKSVYSPPISEPRREEISEPKKEFVLDIRNEADMENYLGKLRNRGAFESFRRDFPFSWLNTHLSRADDVLSKIALLKDFDDEEFNSKLASKVCNLSKHMLDIYKDAENSPQLNENSRQLLRSLVENYLSEIGLTKKIFKVGDAYNDWADLNLDTSSAEIIATDNRALGSTLAAIKIQPHVISYRNEFGEIKQLIFGGLCRAYKFKEV